MSATWIEAATAAEGALRTLGLAGWADATASAISTGNPRTVFSNLSLGASHARSVMMAAAWRIRAGEGFSIEIGALHYAARTAEGACNAAMRLADEEARRREEGGTTP